MALIKTPEQITHIKELADVLSDLLEFSLSHVKPGISTIELDRIIEEKMDELQVTGPCKGYHGFPCVSCISVNDQVTHGIPDETVLNNGDIVDIDLVIQRNGYFADMSKTIPVGPIPEDVKKLVLTAEECLEKGISKVKPGNHIGDIGFAIQDHAEKNGYSVVREYTGHFIGLEMHEDPLVPNRGKKKRGLRLKPGMVLCIEPMINMGRYEVITRGWDARTFDGKYSSRCEHMVLVTQDGHEILTRQPDIHEYFSA
ncbi:MAG: type I methionyl aminopeptidase [Spirochaetia bacterium]